MIKMLTHLLVQVLHIRDEVCGLIELRELAIEKDDHEHTRHSSVLLNNNTAG